MFDRMTKLTWNVQNKPKHFEIRYFASKSPLPIVVISLRIKGLQVSWVVRPDVGIIVAHFFHSAHSSLDLNSPKSSQLFWLLL